MNSVLVVSPLVALLWSACIVPGPPPGDGPSAAPVGATQVVPVGGTPPAASSGYSALVIDGVDLDPSFGDGYPPTIFVSALVNGQAGSTTDSYDTFDPTWDEAVLTSDDARLSDGIDFQVWFDDGGGAALAGEIQYAPAPSDFDGGLIDLGAFGYVLSARFALNEQ